MWERIKGIHPGWFISGFFAILIIFNAVFFIIAANLEVRLVPRDGSGRGALGSPHQNATALPARAPSASDIHGERDAGVSTD